MGAPAAEWMNELALQSGLGGAKEKSDKDALWVGELTDKLTVAIALREWDKAVALVEEGDSIANVRNHTSSCHLKGKQRNLRLPCSSQN